MARDRAEPMDSRVFFFLSLFCLLLFCFADRRPSCYNYRNAGGARHAPPLIDEVSRATYRYNVYIYVICDNFSRIFLSFSFLRLGERARSLSFRRRGALFYLGRRTLHPRSDLLRINLSRDTSLPIDSNETREREREATRVNDPKVQSASTIPIDRVGSMLNL